MNARQRKEEFLRNETALSQSEAALILGCRARDVQDEMEPSFYSNGRPKYRQADVIKVRDRKAAAVEKIRDRNTRMLQGA